MRVTVRGRRRHTVPATPLAVAIRSRLAEILDEERGATATEYALLVTLIAIVIATGVMFFGTNLDNLFHSLGSTISPYTS